MWIDELITITRAIHIDDLSAGLWSEGQTQWSLSLVAVSGALGILGPDVWSLRLLPALVGTMLVPATYWAARATGCRREAALLAAALCSLSPAMLFYAQSVRYYTAAAILGTVGAVVYLQAVRTGSAVRAVVALLTLGLAVLERLHAVFLVLGMAGSAVIAWRSRQLDVDRARGMQSVVICSILLVGMGLILELLRLRGLIHGSAAGLTGAVDVLTRHAATGPVSWFKIWTQSIGLPVTGLAVVGAVLAWTTGTVRGRGLVSLAVIPIACLGVVAAFGSVGSRFAVAVLPLWFVLAAWGVEALVGWLGNRAGMVVLVGVVLAASRDWTVRDYGALTGLSDFAVSLSTAVAGTLMVAGAAVILRQRGLRHVGLAGVAAVGLALTHYAMGAAYYHGPGTGHRDNWSSIQARVGQVVGEGESILAADPLLASHLLGRAVASDEFLTSTKSTWVVVESGNAERVGLLDGELATCQLVVRDDRRLHARTWLMRLYHCASRTGSSGKQ